MSSEIGDYGGETNSERQKPDCHEFKNIYRLKNYRNGEILCERKEKDKIIAKERCYIKVVFVCLWGYLFIKYIRLVQLNRVRK